MSSLSIVNNESIYTRFEEGNVQAWNVIVVESDNKNDLEVI